MKVEIIKEVSELLKPYVFNFFKISSKENSATSREKIFPDLGAHLILFIQSDVTLAIDNHSIKPDGAMLSGIFSKYYEYESIGNTLAYGVSFLPTALVKIFGADMGRLYQTFLPFENFSGEEADKLFHKVSLAKDSFKECKRILENYLEEKTKKLNDLPEYRRGQLSTVDELSEEILKQNGRIKIADLINNKDDNRKYIERAFKKNLGLSPLSYARTIRFMYVLSRMNSDPADIKDAVFDYDYFDQSHFYKDFQTFMGESFSEYTNKHYPLIKNFLNKGDEGLDDYLRYKY